MTDIPEDGVPLTEPEIEILPELVPLVDMLDLPDAPGHSNASYNPTIEIPDEDVPLAMLPQTGLLWWPVPVMAMAGIALVIFGVCANWKAAHDE